MTARPWVRTCGGWRSSSTTPPAPGRSPRPLPIPDWPWQTLLIGTVLGSGVWVWLMSRHPAGRVAPFSMLVPVSGLTTAWLVLGETPNLLELFGGALVIGGVLWASLRRRGAPDAPVEPTAESPHPLRETPIDARSAG